jgi:hypothetical protein
MEEEKKLERRMAAFRVFRESLGIFPTWAVLSEEGTKQAGRKRPLA